MTAPSAIVAPDDTLAVLEAVREFLTEETWCAVDLARDAFGGAVEPENPEACEFCLIGAVIRLTGRTFVPERVELALLEAMPPGEESLVHEFNDDRGLDAVHALLDRAIANERDRRAA